MRVTLAAVLCAGCAAHVAVANEPVVAAPPPAVLPEAPPPSVPLADIGAGDPAEASELAVPHGAPTFARTRVVANPSRRETWSLIEDGTRRVVRLVVDEEKTPGAWTEIGHAGWVGRAETNGAIELRLVERSGALAWAPSHLEGTCNKTQACTEDKPAVKRPGRHCDVTIDDETESVVLGSPDLAGAITEACARPHVEPRVYAPMRRRMRHSDDY